MDIFVLFGVFFSFSVLVISLISKALTGVFGRVSVGSTDYYCGFEALGFFWCKIKSIEFSLCSYSSLKKNVTRSACTLSISVSFLSEKHFPPE